MRRIYDLHEYGWGYLQALEEFNEDSSYTRRIYSTPGTPVMAHFLARLTARKLYRRAGSLFGARRNKWFIAYRHRVGLRTALTDRKDFHVIFPPRGRFYADPFLIERQGKTYLFFEDFDYSKNRAGISSVELRDKDFSQPTTVLEKPYHLSYPFLLEWEGHVYMIPETRERGTIELYRAVDFPQKWELCNILAEGVLAVDPTIFPHNGKLWLFANISVPGASTFDELHLFYADSLEGKWTPHPKNPIVSDVRRARPAGALFFEGHKLIRPSQDCSVRYGGSLSFNEVQVLSETDYREKPYGVIRPDWFPRSVCTHTYNRTDQYEVLDGMLIGRV